MSYNFTMVEDPDTGKQFISVFVPGEGFKSADSGHPMFASVVAAVTSGDPDVDVAQLLTDIAGGIVKAVEDANLSSRVSVENGELTLDGQPLNDALSNHILKLMAEQSGDLTGWVRFLERIEANPNEHSRKMLFSWLESLDKNDGGITIDAKTGFLVGYKGVRKNDDGSLVSVQSGPAIVDGQQHSSGPVPNAIGSVIEMKREDVQHDPSIGCSRGLHVGTWNYAHGWAQGAVLEVHVDPADVGSVPTDCDAQKMRCSKYTVVGVLDAPYNTATLPVDGGDEDNDEFRWDDDEYDDDAVSDLPEGITDRGAVMDDDADAGYCGNCHDDGTIEVLDDETVICTWHECMRVVHPAV